MALRDVSMKVDIEAHLPSLKKNGKLSALRHISKLGKITYEVLGFNGDTMVKKDVIARYIEAEIKSSDSAKRDLLALNADNYRFRFRGMYGVGDWQLYLYEVKPRKKRIGLFEGWLWIEAASGLPVRESGRLVRTPSVFLKRVEFVRDYDTRQGFPLPVRIESQILTRLVGMAELTIRFQDVRFHGDAQQITAQNLSGGR